MSDSVREGLIARLRRAAEDGLISATDRDIRIANVRAAGSEIELEMIRRELELLRPAVVPPVPVAVAVPASGGVAGAPGLRSGLADARALIRPVLVPILLVAVFTLGVMITWAFRSMRSVMEVGGSCASGGPYEISQPCPDGTWMIAVAIPAVVIAGFLGTAVAVVLRAPNLMTILWLGLFGSLGWNFLEYGLGAGGNAGTAVVGVVFWLMALPAVPAILFSGAMTARLRRLGSGAGPSVRSSLRRAWSWLAIYAVVGAVGVRLGSSWWQTLA